MSNPSSAGRALALLLVGLFMGAMLALVASKALQQKAGYSDGLMAVLQQHLQALRQQSRAQACAEAPAAHALQRLALLAEDIPAALPEHGTLVAEMTHDLQLALARPATSPACESLPQRVQRVDAACKACHSQLR